MPQISENAAQELEKLGFSRWQKGTMDRLYFNIRDMLDVDIGYYNTENVRSAYVNGELVENCEWRRMKEDKVYINVNTGKLMQTSNSSLLSYARNFLLENGYTVNEDNELVISEGHEVKWHVDFHVEVDGEQQEFSKLPKIVQDRIMGSIKQNHILGTFEY